MRLVATRKAHQNQAAIDPWSFVHLGSGLALGLMNMPRRLAIVGSIAYEIVEQVAERRQWGKYLFHSSGPESLPNAIVDVLMVALGHRLGEAWNRTGPPRSRG